MRNYKATYKDRDGKKRKTAKWYCDFSDHNQLRHKIPAFADKRLSIGLGQNIESLVNCRISGLEPDVKLNQWIETLPDSLLKKFVSWGVIDGQRAEITKPLTEHIKDYVKILEAKGNSKGYIRHSQNRLKQIINDCRFIATTSIQLVFSLSRHIINSIWLIHHNTAMLLFETLQNMYYIIDLAKYLGFTMIFII